MTLDPVVPHSRPQPLSLIMHSRCWTDTGLMPMEYKVQGVGEELHRVKRNRSYPSYLR